MAKLKKQQRTESIAGGYSAIPWAVQDSISFMGASDKAKSLLFALMRQHNGSNNGHLHLAKSWLYSHGWTCDENNRKACHELIERGLIVHTKHGGLNMGPNLYAVTWHNITNYIGLDISAKTYSRGAYLLCSLAPTQRRKPPIKKKWRHDSRDSASTTTETASQSTSTTTELVKPILSILTSTTTEHNVFIPLPVVNSLNRSIAVNNQNASANQKKTTRGNT